MILDDKEPLVETLLGCWRPASHVLAVYTYAGLDEVSGNLWKLRRTQARKLPSVRVYFRDGSYLDDDFRDLESATKAANEVTVRVNAGILSLRAA